MKKRIAIMIWMGCEMKTDQTRELEAAILSCTKRKGIYWAFEATFNYDERVDFITVETKDIIRCYEIKVSKPDFYSKCKKSFYGHFNYYVMPQTLYEQVKKDIPDHIGVHTGDQVIKRPKKQYVSEKDISEIKTRMLCASCRDAEKFYTNRDKSDVVELNKKILNLKREIQTLHNQITEMDEQYCWLERCNYERKS